MAETISMPKLGFDMAEGTLVRWVKQVGENINKGDVLAEIETDKATVEVESSASGVILQLMVDQGSVVPVNAPIAVIGAEGEKVGAAPKPESEKPKVPEQKTEQPKAEEKAEEKPEPQTQPTAVPVAETAAPPVDSGPVKASPLAKKVARDNKVDLSRVQGTGPGGRVVRKDVEAALSGAIQKADGRKAAPAPTVVPVSAGDETIQLTKLRQAIARRMTESTTSVPHFYV